MVMVMVNAVRFLVGMAWSCLYIVHVHVKVEMALGLGGSSNGSTIEG